MSREVRTYHLVKYTLSSSKITAFAGEISLSGRIWSPVLGMSFKIGVDCFETHAAAVKYVRDVMIPKKQNSLLSQLKALKKLVESEFSQ